MSSSDKQFLANLGSVVPGESTDQIIKLAGGPAQDSGARKAALMHSINAGNIDKQVIAASSKRTAIAEAKAAKRARQAAA